MSRSFRSALCAVSMFAFAASGANAQTVPTTITTTTAGATTPTTSTTAAATNDFSPPAACQVASADDLNVDDNHGEEVRACIYAVHQELAQDDEHHGLGEWVSAVAGDHGRGHKDDDDSGTSTMSSRASTMGTTTTTSGTAAPSTPTMPTAQSAPSTSEHGKPEHAHGHGHGDD